MNQRNLRAFQTEHPQEAAGDIWKLFGWSSRRPLGTPNLMPPLAESIQSRGESFAKSRERGFNVRRNDLKLFAYYEATRFR
jgi:hypothetical protein